MYEVKKQIYLNFTKNQKSALCNYIRALVKKYPQLNADEIFDKFTDDEKYYLELDCSKFEFLKDFLSENWFKNDTTKFIKACKKYYDYKESQRPVIEANKAFEKQKREFLKKVKMSKEQPTKKQLYYYEKLCKKYGLDKKELASKLEAMEEIDKIITEHNNNYKNILLNEDN